MQLGFAVPEGDCPSPFLTYSSMEGPSGSGQFQGLNEALLFTFLFEELPAGQDAFIREEIVIQQCVPKDKVKLYLL